MSATPFSTRRGLLRTLAAAAAAAPQSFGQSNRPCPPSEVLRWIVPNSAGGGYDSYSRLLEPLLERELTCQIRIDNQPGVGGLRGARLIRDAEPDGATVGIINAPAVLMTALTGDSVLDPISDYAPLGTIAKSSYVWATGATSSIRSVDDLATVARSTGLVFGVNSHRDQTFLLPAMTTSMLGWKAHFVSGYGGTGARALAAIRGEVDLVALSWELLVRRMESGDMRPIVAMSPEVRTFHSSFASLPSMIGEDGLFPKLAPSRSRDVESLVRLMGAGRVIVAPHGLERGTAECLRISLCNVLNSDSLSAAARSRGLLVQSLCAAETTERLQASRSDLKRLGPLVRAAIDGAQR